MSAHRGTKRIQMSEPRSTRENQGGSEVAAGKREVMEKFFTPLQQSAPRRSEKGARKGGASSDVMRDPYYTESFSSSPSSSSSSPWSSESNFGQRRFFGYQPGVPYSRSCNDISVGRRRNNDGSRDLNGKQKETHSIGKGRKGDVEKQSREGSRVGASNLKGHLSHSKDGRLNEKCQTVDKRAIKISRRAKSMEVLAQKDSQKGESKRKVVEEKKRFSQFLDEITVQVLSPSNLTSLGVKEGQTVGTREQWKSSSTDSSGSKGKRNQLPATGDPQDSRRKGKGKLEVIPNPKVNIKTSERQRNRDMSTSPDSASSSARHRRGGVNSSPRKSIERYSSVGSKASGPLKGKEMSRDGSHSDHTEREWKEVHGSKDRVLQGKVQVFDKSLKRCKSDLTSSNTTQEPLIPPPEWWRDMDHAEAPQPLENQREGHRDLMSRTKDNTSTSQITCNIQENNYQSCVKNETSETNKDSLNGKITELLEHLVRAQSTICALEKLNVSSLLGHLSPNKLEAANVSHQAEDQINTSNLIDISLESQHQDICGGEEKQTTTEEIMETTRPHLTAFSPWSPRRARTLSSLHQLYNSTESEGSLDDLLPACKLLSPRFPYLGESFSDDRMDQESSNITIKGEQRAPVALKPTSPSPSLLPAHHIPPRSHRTEASSSESSGDDPLLIWGQSQGAQLDYHSAQKILDSLLGISSDGKAPVSLPKVQEINEHHQRPHLQLTNHPQGRGFIANPKYETYTGVIKDNLSITSKSSNPERSPCHSPNHLRHTRDNPYNRFHPDDPSTLQHPVKLSPIPKLDSTTFLPLSSKEDTHFHTDGKQEDTSHLNKDSLHSLSVPEQSSLHPQHSLNSYVLRSPSDSGPTTQAWESHYSCQSPTLERGIERRPRKERIVHFNMTNAEDQGRDVPLTQKSKFMSSRHGGQRMGDNSLLDSTFL